MSDEEDWRAEVEFSTETIRVGGRFEFTVTQQDELPPFAALAMLAELGESASEISGKRVWAGSQAVRAPHRARGGARPHGCSCAGARCGQRHRFYGRGSAGRVACGGDGR